MRNSMRSLEARWNRRYGYPWVFLNDEPFDEEFKVGVKKMTRSEVFFGESLVPLAGIRAGREERADRLSSAM